MRIEFCVLSSQEPQARYLAACELASRAWRAGRAVFIRTQSLEQCGELDELLWHFRGEVFIPHAQVGIEDTAPVLIGTSQTPPQPQTVLINLNLESPAQLIHCARLIELVDQDPQRLQKSREHFRHYQTLGHTPKRIAL